VHLQTGEYLVVCALRALVVPCIVSQTNLEEEEEEEKEEEEEEEEEDPGVPECCAWLSYWQCRKWKFLQRKLF
jgi:hypothetical protein